MPGFQRSRIWDEKELTDAIKSSILDSPDATMITSATSNVQIEPCCLVLLDHKYPLMGITSVTVKRSRGNNSNTASISMVNYNVRYSGPNKEKIAANTPISIYMGYSKRYIQRFEGYIDVTSMSVNGSDCTIQIECRDKAKDLIEREISCGIYSDKSEYLGAGEWHYKLGQSRIGGYTPHEPRPWTRSEVIRDVCYILGLRDIVPFITVEAVKTPTGYEYKRKINYAPDFDIRVDPKWDTVITCNFVEELALDIIGKLAQSIFHETFFDNKGRLVVRPVKTSLDDPVYYFKEERDIETLTQKIDDDNVTNIITVIGQTADETAVIYPFAAVAVSDMVTLEKGQDKYGWTLEYPKLVAQENIHTLQHPSLWAFTIAPNAEPVASALDNPENKPSYDVRTHFPNFASPYEKQECLDATCPIITDEAAMADSNNVRTWNYYGTLDTAVAYEKQPLMLVDRFGKPLLVVCKERSMDDNLIQGCGNTPWDPEKSPDPNDTPVNIPSVMLERTYSVDATGHYTYTENDNVSIDLNPPSSYASVPGTIAGTYMLAGIEDVQDIPASVAGQMPKGLTEADFTGKGFKLTQFTVTEGTSPFATIGDHLFDMASMVSMSDYMAVCHCKQDIAIHQYTDPNTGATYLSSDGVLIPGLYKDISVVSLPSGGVSSLYSNCAMSATSMLELDPPTTYTPYNALPLGVVDDGFQYNLTIEYPMIFFELSSTLTESVSTWHFTLVTADILAMLDAVNQSAGKTMTVYTAAIDRRYVTSSDPDCNCVYWRWYGNFKKPATPSGRDVVVQSTNPGSPLPAQGEDFNGDERVSITKEKFYELAADPNTVVIQCTTSGVDHKSWAEVIEFDEYKIVCKGHNQYGSMKDAWDEFLDNLSRILDAISLALLLLALATLTIITTPGASYSPGAPAADEQAGVVSALVMAFIAIMLQWMKDKNKNIGANISKVMENMGANITGIRRPEIELFESGASQAAEWWIRDADNVKIGTMEHTRFEYQEGSSLSTIYQPNNQTNVSNTGLSRTQSWVFVMDLTRANQAGGDFSLGSWVTGLGWETPEIGDRKPLEYYTGKGYDGTIVTTTRKEITCRFAIEAFGDDAEDSMYSAETLLGLRFENDPNIGITPGTNELWYNSNGYELLVDRSMTEMTLSDTGLWWDFFEKRDNFKDRRYKYIALVIYSWHVKEYDLNTGALVTDEQYIDGAHPIDDTVVFDTNRWGIFIPRGLNPGWYEKWRWLEKDPVTNISKREQNYAKVNVLFSGQQRLIANLLNNFKYSAVTIELRVWGKAYGIFAPSIVYYQANNLLSIGTYGSREMTLTNNCINDFKTARKLANLLTAQSNESVTITTTGKPYVFEGDVAFLKEENSGVAAGTYRSWENIWKDPEQKNCTQPGNQLGFQSIPGVYEPQYSCATFENNTLIACSNGTGRLSYLLEIDKACNPIWYAMSTTSFRPVYATQWTGVGNQLNRHQVVATIVALEDGTILKIDYILATLMDSCVLPDKPVAATMDEENAMLFVACTTMVCAINMNTFAVDFIENLAGVTGISACNNLVYDDILQKSAYREMGVVFLVGSGGIVCRQIYTDRNRTAMGPVVNDPDGNPALITPGNAMGIPFTNPGSIEYDKDLQELIYVNKATANEPATIWSLKCEIDFDPSHPELGMTAEFFDEPQWRMDYMEDNDLKASFPDNAARVAYINQFFRPVHAKYDVNKDLLVTDTDNNRVYRINSSGKFYVTSMTDQFDRSDDGDSYKNTYELVAINAAGSLQLTNFGKNFINTKTQEQITAATNIAIARILSYMGRDKYEVKLLSSDTTMEAINNSGQNLRVRDTVMVATGYGGDTSGVGTIIAKKALHDWTIETGDPYVYSDATSIDVTKYGQTVSESGSGGSSADMSAYNARIRMLENRIVTLGGLHGIKWN